jgi:hypothetical protein
MATSVTHKADMSIDVWSHFHEYSELLHICSTNNKAAVLRQMIENV